MSPRRCWIGAVLLVAACTSSESSSDGGRADTGKSDSKVTGSGGSSSSGSGGMTTGSGGSGGAVGSGGATGTGGASGPVDAKNDVAADAATDAATDHAATDGAAGDAATDHVDAADTAAGDGAIDHVDADTAASDSASDHPADTAADTAADTGGPEIADASDGGGADGNHDGNDGEVASPAADFSMLERNGDPAKTGHFIRPLLTKVKAATLTADTGFNATYQGNLWNVPLYLQKGPNNKGAFYVATQDNMVYALDETTGAQLWNVSAGPVAQGSPCANGYDAVGVFSTPVIDAASRTLFVATANGPTGIQSFKVHGYNVDTGDERAGWPVDVGQVISGFQPAKQNQRTALSLVKGILYVAFGGHAGDCGPYRGRVLAIDITDPTHTGNWATTGDGEAIWGAGGMASDGDGVYAVTGNRLGAGGAHQDSEEIVHLSGLAVLNRNDQNIFYPARWDAMDGSDLDFGCNAPTLFSVPGATTSKFVAAAAKDGHLYFLDAANLGGMGGEKFDLVIAQEGMSTRTSPTAYMTTQGMFVAVSTNGAHCPVGGPTGSVVMGVRIDVIAGAIQPTVAWCAALDGGALIAPVSTTSDGINDAIVWYSSNGALKGVDGETGAAIFSGGNCPIQRWTTPIVAGAARIVVGSDGKLCSWSVK